MSTTLHPLHWKLEVATRGVRRDATFPLVASSDVQTAALDLVLDGDLRVLAPIDVPGSTAPLTLTGDSGRYFLTDGRTGACIEVRATRAPRFYARRTASGVPMRRIATVQGSHLLVHPSSLCGFSLRGAPCRFCVEGARATSDRDTAVSVLDVVEVVRAAFDEGAADFVYFNSAVFDAEDGGMAFLAPYVEAVRKHFDALVAVQVHPPRVDRWIDRTYAMGVDAISYNLEIYDAELLGRYCIGRARYVGRDRYLEALAYAATIFPRGTVWSDLVLGLEPHASTMAGIDALSAIGVVPVAAVRRPTGEPAPGIAIDDTTPVMERLYRAAREHHVTMGWVRDLSLGVTPLEARWAAGDDARLAVAMQSLTRSRLGALAARGLARFRRRLRVRNVSDGVDTSHL